MAVKVSLQSSFVIVLICHPLSGYLHWQLASAARTWILHGAEASVRLLPDQGWRAQHGPLPGPTGLRRDTPEPAQGISDLSGCLGPPWPPEGPQEHIKLHLNSKIIYIMLWVIIHIRTAPKINSAQGPIKAWAGPGHASVHQSLSNYPQDRAGGPC